MAIPVAWLAGCSDGGVTDLTSAPDERPLMSTHASAAASFDVGGDWLWSQELMLSFPAWVAEGIFGIQPEGPTTTARCAASGTMTLVQTGSEFSGASQGTGGQCVTRGGQVFLGVAPGVPEPILDGQVRGRSIEMHHLGAGGTVDCTYHGVISHLQGGTATVLNARAPCVIPGHPKSAIPLDPPPAGTQTVLSWTAVRP